jgi:hypothetical protein
MITREEKIRELTDNELRWLIGSPDNLEDVTQFFVAGGFFVYTDDALNDQYTRLMG